MSNAESLRDILRFLNTHEFSRDSDANQINYFRLDADCSEEGPLRIVDGAIVVDYATLLLGSSFQPIVAGADRIVGYKALVTARSVARNHHRVVDIPSLTLAESDRSEVIYRDRLTRTMHALNYLANELEGDLHMSVNAQHLQAVHQNHGEVFGHILAQCGLQPDRIVLDIQEYAVNDKQHLRAAIAAWQQRRYRIAIDRFGAEHAQLSRVLALHPDIIKFDGGFIARLSATAASKKKLDAILAQIGDGSIRAIATGIDDETLYEVARAYPFFARQGQFFAREGQYVAERAAVDAARADNLKQAHGHIRG